MADRVLRAGVAQRDITPPIGIEMGGFGRRVQPSIGVLDPLFAKALILDDGRERVGIVSCDLLGFSDEFDQQLRQEIAATGAIKADNVMIACTHNHAGPATQFLRNCGTVNEEWMAALRRSIIEVVKQAANALRAVTVEYSWGRANLNHNRRFFSTNANSTRKQGERNTRVSIVQFKSGRDVTANLLHYACHPVTMLWENRMLSSEYCGQACSLLEAATGAPALFLNGACGDVNPLIADNAGKLSPVTEYSGRNYEDVVQFGGTIARVATRALQRRECITAPNLHVEMQRVAVPLRVPEESEVEAALRSHRSSLKAAYLSETERWIHSTYFDWAQQAKAAMQSGAAPRSTLVSLQKIFIGNLSLVGVSGELFAAIGKRIQKLVGDPCLVVGYANGNVGYLPTRNAFSKGGYEVEDAGRLYGLFGVGIHAESILLKQFR